MKIVEKLSWILDHDDEHISFDETYQIILHAKVIIRSVVGWGYYVREMEVSMTISCRIVSEMMAMPNK